MKHLFIVGVGRSGTSLLQSMLAAHPAIAMLPETGLLRRYVFDGSDRLARDPSAAREDDQRLQRIPKSCWERAVPDGATAAVAVYRALHTRESAMCVKGDRFDPQIVGDKDPRLVEFLPLLSALFPEDVFVIHIVRDPRDVLLSKIKAGWSADRNWRINLVASRVQLALAERYGEQTFGARWIPVRYEDLIRDPAAVLAGITERIGITYDERMLQFSDAARRLSGGAVEDWKRETLGPLLPGNHDKWRDGLTAAQIDATEAVTDRWMRRYGYTSTPGVPLRRLLYRWAIGGVASLYVAMRRVRNRRMRRHLGGRS